MKTYQITLTMPIQGRTPEKALKKFMEELPKSQIRQFVVFEKNSETLKLYRANREDDIGFHITKMRDLKKNFIPWR